MVFETLNATYPTYTAEKSKVKSWVLLTPHTAHFAPDAATWRQDTKAALSTLAAHGLVEYHPTDAGFAVRTAPPKAPPVHKSRTPLRGSASQRLQSYYAARDWAILQHGAAHAAESIVAGTRGLQCMRLDSESDTELTASRRDGRGDAVLAVRRHAPDHGWAELVTFSARDAAAVRAALRTMETRLPMEWHESCAEDAADCEDGCGAGKVCPEEEVEERGVHFVARLEWPTSLIEQERIDQGSDEGRIRLVGKEEGEHAEDKRKEIVRGMKLLMRGSDGLEINYQVEDGEITVTPPWVLERHSGGHPALV